MLGSRRQGGWDPGNTNFEENTSSTSSYQKPWTIKGYLCTMTFAAMFGFALGYASGDFIARASTKNWDSCSETEVIKESREKGGLIGLIGFSALGLAASGRGFYRDMKNKYQSRRK